MNSREQLVQTFNDEMPRFVRALEAVPEGHLDYRPHERSRTTGDLLALFADEADMLLSVVRTGKFDMGGFTPSTYPTAAAAAATFRKKMEGTLEALASCDDARWEGPARFMSGEKVEWETTVGQMCWGFLLDLIHHRGQLTVYLRPMGGKVPAIYGPSADANG